MRRDSAEIYHNIGLLASQHALVWRQLCTDKNYYGNHLLAHNVELRHIKTKQENLLDGTRKHDSQFQLDRCISFGNYQSEIELACGSPISGIRVRYNAYRLVNLLNQAYHQI